MRHDLAFFLCCCKSFLGSPQDDQDGQESFYQLLGLERDASHEDIKRAYKRQSLQMHPDKLAQRGQKVTEADQAKFTRMKEAYECLSDPHKRETYDTIGERGMKWLEEPFSMDPQELAHNFAKSSALDRSKIFAIFVVIAIAVLLLPLLVCLHIDGVFGANASWMATLTPLWIWNVILLAYHVRIIMMGPIQRPEHIPPEEWVDPLPMKKRIFSMARFTLIVLFELLVALRLDKILTCKWTFVFVPLFIWEATTLYKRWPLARMRIVTVEDLEIALGKPFAEFTAAEKELIGKRYSVVPSTSSPDFEAAQKLKSRARQDMMKSLVRLVFVALLLVQIDGVIDWNWWLVFTPFWIMTVAICLANYQSFAAVQQMAADKDPTLFGLEKKESATAATSEANAAETGTTNYGSVGLDGTATPEATKTGQPQSELSEAEREELKAAVMASGTKLCSKCCSQGFLLILICLFVAKLQGGGFSSLWIISPFLFAVSEQFSALL
jgi:DnaJ domain/Transmembrane Fragile-X-F protein